MCVVVGVAGLVACGSSSKDSNPAGPTTPIPADGGTVPGEGGGGDGGADGATADLPKPVFCPEANPFVNPSYRSGWTL